jgi:RNA polymerase sigma-70 factor (ECF subfamily)
MASSTRPHPDLSEQLTLHREKLKRMVACRMDRRIRGRVDPSDVIQEAFVEAARRYDDYQREAKMPMYLWLRFLTLQQLLIFHRRHLAAKNRSVNREEPLHGRIGPAADLPAMAEVLSASITTPSSAAARRERQLRLLTALNQLDPKDQEVLTLRHFEQLNTIESAQVLGISEALVSTRYGRAIRKLSKIMTELYGSESEPRA